jgi:hypothetical protein
MNKALGIAMLAVGAALIIFGVNESDSFSSDVSRFFTGNPTDKSMWMLIAGIGTAVLGFFLTLTRSVRS